MSTGEMLYLAMVILAMFAFMGTLSFVTYGGKSSHWAPRATGREAHASAD